MFLAPSHLKTVGMMMETRLGRRASGYVWGRLRVVVTLSIGKFGRDNMAAVV